MLCFNGLHWNDLGETASDDISLGLTWAWNEAFARSLCAAVFEVYIAILK